MKKAGAPMTKLKVWGGNFDGRHRLIVAATSRAKAAAAFGVSISAMQFAATTRNKEEMELALRDPGMVWKKGDNLLGGEWRAQDKPLPAGRSEEGPVP